MGSQAAFHREEAFRHVMAHRTMLAAYVRAIIYDPDLAEDTLADVSVEIVRAWDSFDRGRPFAPWARGVARRIALANLRRRRANPALLDAEVLESVGAEIDAFGGERHMEERLQALRACVGKLPEFERHLVQMRYFDQRPYEEIARAVTRTVEALYVAYHRLHKALRQCVERSLASS